MTLHTINKSKDPTLIAQCLRYCAEGDSLVLMEDGVHAALSAFKTVLNSEPVPLHDLQIYALEEDILFRGLDIQKIQESIKVISISTFIELTVSHSKVISWT